jgi:long-chain acyl-CoA synthetase
MELNPVLYLERNVREAPRAVFMESGDQRILNSEALINVKKIAYEFRRLGVKPGDIIALDLPESLSILFTEAVFHEAAVSTMPPRGFDAHGAFEISWTFTNSAEAHERGGQVIAVDAQFLQRVDENPSGISCRTYESEDSLLWILYSSGTTGAPNAIAVTLGKLDDYATNAIDTWMKGDPFLTFLGARTPLGLYALYISVRTRHPHLALGNDLPANVKLAADNSVTSLKASPAQLVGFVDELEAQGRTLPFVQTIYTVGTSMPPALAARLREMTEGCEIYSLYGATEAGMAFVRYYETEDPFDVGQLFPGARVEVVDDDDQVLPAGQTGNIRLQGPVMVHEYLGNPDASRESFKDGWFYPGDLGFIRPDGGLTLAGRSSELINAGGVKIDPARLDLFAVKNPKVRDACSFAYTTGAGTQQVGIALVTEGGLDVQSLIRDFEKEFGSAAPKLVARVDQVPRNAMGKPLRLTFTEKYNES